MVFAPMALHDDGEVVLTAIYNGVGGAGVGCWSSSEFGYSTLFHFNDPPIY